MMNVVVVRTIVMMKNTNAVENVVVTVIVTMSKRKDFRI